MIDRRAPSVACPALVVALTCLVVAAPEARAQDRAEPGASLPDGEADAAAAAVTSSAVAHRAALCARLDDLMKQGLSYAERRKTAETRAALHCPPTSGATQAAEGSRPVGR